MLPAYNEEQQEARLGRMKRMATGLLVAMAVVFLFAHYYRDDLTWLYYVRAFAEAAMVGALADWFAVTALFRHPLGIPIPHTAIIPKRKNEIGASLAGFVRENFLTPEVLEPRLKAIHFSQRIGVWLAKEKNAKRVTQDAKIFVHWFFNAVDNQSIREFAQEHLRMSLTEVQAAPFLSKVLELLTVRNRHQNLMDLALRSAWQALQKNKHKLRDKIEKQSPWWIPSFVDEEIYDKISHEIEQGILKIGSDDSHEARQSFNEGLQGFIERLRTDPEMIARGEAIKNELLEHPAVQGYLTEMWSSISTYLLREIDDPDSEIRVRLENGVQSFGQSLLENTELGEQIDAWLQQAGLYLVDQYRSEISNVITETINSWDPDVTSHRIELQVGRDLQFIRINGTLVGGCAGLAIYVIARHLLN